MEKTQSLIETRPRKERVVLVGVDSKQSIYNIEDSLEELGELADRRCQTDSKYLNR